MKPLYLCGTHFPHGYNFQAHDGALEPGRIRKNTWKVPGHFHTFEPDGAVLADAEHSPREGGTTLIREALPEDAAEIRRLDAELARLTEERRQLVKAAIERGARVRVKGLK
jgi:hypothetical protein